MTETAHIPFGKRAVIVGRTGSGKSSLASFILRNSPSQWVILNPKGTAAYNKLPDAITINALDYRKIVAAIKERNRDGLARYRFINIIPSRIHANFEVMDDFIGWMHDSYVGVGLVADELYTLHKGGRPGDGLMAWLTRGRELKQSFLGLTQRPAWISKFIFSEADYIGEMSLTIMEDRKTMYQNTGVEAMLGNLPQYKWYWYDVGNENLRLFGPVPI